mmetsp:Transcript_8466/g.15963  ORF Transcript_8466/g.15963 Transcript_8466/m.15963 type:complete len:406 (-) Transcript_8466:106-1323(-)
MNNSNIADSSSTATNNSANAQAPQEALLRKQLYSFHKKISKREPLDPSYKFLIKQNTRVKAPQIYLDKMYVNFTADLREKVESYMGKYGSENPATDGRKAKIGNNRADLDVEMMKNALKLRECKTFEQEAFIEAELDATKAKRLRCSLVNEGTRRRWLEAIALGLQERERKKQRRDGKLLAAVRQKMLEAEKVSLEMKKALVTDETEAAAIEEQLRQKEEEARKVKEKQMQEEQRFREIEEAKRREQERQQERERQREEERERQRLEQEREERMRKARRLETPQQALHRIYEPLFQTLWEMDFFDGTNPFRLVITKENCDFMGAPGYCDVVKKPMNLTWVREKVTNFKYETLQEFFQDIELIVSNALLYNSDPNNPYHKAANVMKNKYIKLRKNVLVKLQEQHQF